MCGRYFLDFDAVNFASFGAEERGKRDLRPNDTAPAIVRAPSGDEVRRMQWGFENDKGTRLINARSETMRERPAFRALADRQRCALPASGYYEWRGDGQQYDIARRDGAVFYLAGLYRMGRQGAEFVILTQPPVPGIARFHDRMPLLLPDRTALDAWLDGKDMRFADEALLSIESRGDEQLSFFD